LNYLACFIGDWDIDKDVRHAVHLVEPKVPNAVNWSEASIVDWCELISPFERVLILPVSEYVSGDSDAFMHILKFLRAIWCQFSCKKSSVNEWEVVIGKGVSRTHYRVDERLTKHFLDQLVHLFNCISVGICIKLSWLVTDDISCDNDDIDLIIVILEDFLLELSEQYLGTVDRQIAICGTDRACSVAIRRLLIMTAPELAAVHS